MYLLLYLLIQWMWILLFVYLLLPIFDQKHLKLNLNKFYQKVNQQSQYLVYKLKEGQLEANQINQSNNSSLSR
jgi:hypothetical protein